MNRGKLFQKKKENFQCEQCNFLVMGDGYTNHCPKCLYSKHVDIHPGDRMEACGGLMEPIALVKENREERLTQRCIRCGFTRKNKVNKNDDFEAVLAVARKNASLM